MAKKKCELRHADLDSPRIFQGFLSSGHTATLYSTLGCYSSDIGKIMVRHTTNAGAGNTFSMATPTSDITGKIFGFLKGFDADSSNVNSQQYIQPGSTEKIYLEKFCFDKEYSISYSTLNSTVHPATSDIGSLVGFATTHFSGSSAISITPAYMDLCMSNIASTVNPGLTGSTNGPKVFRVTGYSTNRRRLFVVPVQESSAFSW